MSVHSRGDSPAAALHVSISCPPGHTDDSVAIILINLNLNQQDHNNYYYGFIIPLFE